MNCAKLWAFVENCQSFIINFMWLPEKCLNIPKKIPQQNSRELLMMTKLPPKLFYR